MTSLMTGSILPRLRDRRLARNRAITAVLAVLLAAAHDIVRHRTDLEGELLALRHQILVLQRRHGG